MDDYINGINAAIHAWQTLGQAVDAVFSRQAALTTGMGSISSASLKAAESLGSGISQGRNLRAVHDELATSMVAGVQAIKSHVMALAEARQIGRDAASVQAEMTRQFDEFRGMLYADTVEWLKNNQARLASQSVTEELAKTSGILKTALQANDAATNASVGAQTRLAIAINSVAKNSTVAFATQSDLRAKTIAFTDAIEQQAYALAAQGVIGKDVQSIYGYITDRVNEMIVAMKGQTSAVLTADDALKAFGDTWETTVSIQRGVTQSQWAVDEAMRALTKTYIDYSGVATSTNVTADAQSYAWAKLGGSLDGVVESLRKQAAAMVQAGQMDSSPAAMSGWITKQLTALRASKPVLAGEIDKYIANINKIAPTVETQADFYTEQAITQLTDYLDAVGKVPPDKRTTMIVLVDEAYGIINDFQFALDSIPDEEVRIDAVWNAEKLREGMNATLAESATKITQFTSALQFLQGGGQYVRNAEAIGAALTYGYNVDPNKFRVLPEGLPTSLISFAMGGIEDHSPHIARGGDWRVFAEPETGGEAYIPLSISKRPRSEQLLKQVASMFGGNYVANAAGNVFAGSAELDMTSSIGSALAGATKGAVDTASFFAALTFAKKLEGIAGARNNVASGGGRERAGGPSEYNEPFAQMLFQKAAGFIGTPYLWGGTSLEGIDCSGFTQAVWKQLGVDLSRTTSTQLRQGTAISAAQARPGDQLFFGTDPNFNDDQHTGFVFDPAKRLMLDASQGAVGIHNWDNYGNVIGYRRYYADGAVITPDHVRTYDSGGVLKPGYTMAYNGTGKDEYVTTSDGQGPGGGTTIEQLHVHTNVPPQEWLDEAQWRRAKGYGL
jgi:cell wall-associated NlpC family hydrolase